MRALGLGWPCSPARINPIHPPHGSVPANGPQAPRQSRRRAGFPLPGGTRRPVRRNGVRERDGHPLRAPPTTYKAARATVTPGIHPGGSLCGREASARPARRCVDIHHVCPVRIDLLSHVRSAPRKRAWTFKRSSSAVAVHPRLTQSYLHLLAEHGRGGVTEAAACLGIVHGLGLDRSGGWLHRPVGRQHRQR